MNWGRRYLSRILGRNLGHSVMSLLLAALLAFAFGILTVIRGIYGVLYQQVEVKPTITGGISYKRAVRISESGYVYSPYFEAIIRGVLAVTSEHDVYMDLVFTNDLSRLAKEPIDWQEGWDENTAMETDQAVCILPAALAQLYGLRLGDKVLVCEFDWLSHLEAGIKTREEDRRIYEIRDEKRPKATIIGFVQRERIDEGYFPAAAWMRFAAIFDTELLLDVAEYTLKDYHQTKEFSQYAEDTMSKSAKRLKLHMDTSYADRIYRIHQLIETLYPLTIAAALLLDGVLSGLSVLHDSKEISILRALGVRVRQSVGLYTMAQVLCALSGLALGTVLVLVIQRPESEAVWKPFAFYSAAHIAACTISSGVSAWLCARKHVLAQLQAKE